ncbi:MAG: M20/M25/M40 family metallo-hydrolase [Cyanobacteria bacterium HKST-UBA03]|nr:M20/M25/M40 family metallo-hydrolase [Cyanobacteria bacterium HKST-UBA03]
MGTAANTKAPQHGTVVDWFKRLVPIANPSKGEDEIRLFIANQIQRFGVGQAEVDRRGNLFLRVPGQASGPTMMFCAHMDSVNPCEGIEPVDDMLDGRPIIRSAGQTILGADDKSGIAVLLALLEHLGQVGLANVCPFECLFTVEEEIGIFGAHDFDMGWSEARAAYALDGEGALGDIFCAGPSQKNMVFACHGRSSHAGIEPEMGINALSLAAKLVDRLPKGRLSPDTTTNIGVISGGKAMNVVPDYVELRAELRSHDEVAFAQVQQDMDAVVSALNEPGTDGQITLTWIDKYRRFDVSPDNHAVVWAQRAAEAIGVSPRLLRMNIGSDAHALNKGGLPAVVLGMGFHRSHSVGEYVFVDELVCVADWVWALLTESGTAGTAT